MSWLSRSKTLVGEDGLDKLARSKVLIVGVGGVGGYALEMIVRCGVGSLKIVDGDVFDETNLNRQILADRSNIGKSKAEEGARRAQSINPDIEVCAVCSAFNESTAGAILSDCYDYVLDCIDSVKDKVLLITECHKHGLKCISAMGAANRLDIDFIVTDIFKTQNDGLARAVRQRLKASGVSAHKVVYSAAAAISSPTLGSVAFPPAVCGITMAREVILDLIEEKNK